MTPPKLQVLEWAQDLTTDELRLLWKLSRLCNDGKTIEGYIDARDQNLMQIWRVGQGLVLTETVNEWDGRELIVYGLIGCGMVERRKEICEDLKVIAKTFDCVRIGGNVSRKGLKKLYDELGAKPVSTFYSLELDRG